MGKTPTGLSRADRKRYMRDYQARRRGSVSYKTQAEDAAVLVALAAGEITTSCAATCLGVDIVEVRKRLADATKAGVAIVRAAAKARMAELRRALDMVPAKGGES